MFDPRRLTNKGSIKPVLASHIETPRKLNFSPCEEVDRSLLIHDDNEEIYSDQSYDEQINDKDIPPEKRSIINDSKYFKQLSLSFYGLNLSSNKSLLKQENESYNFKAESSRLNSSLSPRTNKLQYLDSRKSPFIAFDKSPFHLPHYDYAQVDKKPSTSLTNSRINLIQTKDKIFDKSPKSPNHPAEMEVKGLKSFRIHVQNLNLNPPKSSTKVMYPQLAIGLMGGSATTPRRLNILEQENDSFTPQNRRPSVKKILTIKSKHTVKEYFPSNSSTSCLTSPNSLNSVPKKLKMYAVDSPNTFNLKASNGLDGKVLNKKLIGKEKIPILSTKKAIEEVTIKRNIIPINRNIAQKMGY